MRFAVHINGGIKDVEAKALLDSGATNLFVHWNFVRKHRIPTKAYARPRTIRNVDNTVNTLGQVTNFIEATLKIGNHEEVTRFAITDIGEDDIILGLPWLRKHNPAVNWRKGQLALEDCPLSCQMTMKKRRRQKKKAHKPIIPHRPAIRKAGIRNTIEPRDSAKQEAIRYANRLHRRFVTHKENLRRKEEEKLQRALRNYLDEEVVNKIDIEDDDELWWTPGMDQEEEVEYIRRASKSTELAEEAAKQKHERSFEEIVPEHYREYRKVFDDEASMRFPTSKRWDHEIELKADAVPRKTCKIYPLTPDEQTALDAFLKEHLERKTIRVSNSPFASPFFFVKKKDGKLRPVQDYRQLNDITVKNRYPLPLVTELLDQMAEAKWFTKMDVRFGYNNIRIKDGDQWKAAFLTNRGLFEPMVMFFGLTNSPATFQTMMDDIFSDLIATGKVVIYMDDILVGTETLEEHRHLVQEILRRLQDNDLFLKPEKCTFEAQEIEYLGMILGHGKITMDPVKLEGVLKWPTPKSLTEVRAFLGFGNFY